MPFNFLPSSTHAPTGETFTDVVRSPYYVAPEVLRKHYGPEADVWSAGGIVYILLSGMPPFWGESEQEIFEEVLHAEIDFSSDPWHKISRRAKDLVKGMLVRDPRKRLTAHQVLCHQWVQIDGVAPDKPLDSAVLSRFTQFLAMNKLKSMVILPFLFGWYVPIVGEISIFMLFSISNCKYTSMVSLPFLFVLYTVINDYLGSDVPTLSTFQSNY